MTRRGFFGLIAGAVVAGRAARRRPVPLRYGGVPLVPNATARSNQLIGINADAFVTYLAVQGHVLTQAPARAFRIEGIA